MAAQSQSATRSAEGGATEGSQPQGEQQPPTKTQSGTLLQSLNPSTSSPDSDQQPIATILSKPSTSTPTLQTKEPQKMDFSSSEELPYQEPTSSPINPEPICFVPLNQLSTEQMLAEPEPSSSHSPSSSSPNKPETKTNPKTQTNPESYKVMPESVAEDIIQLFPHNVSDLVFDITPLTTVPSQTSTPTPTFIIPSKPTLPSHPRTTTSAPSSPRKEPEEENLIPDVVEHLETTSG